MIFKLREGIKYAMFDMDGTLLDTMMHWRSVGLEYMDERDILRATPELFRQFAPDRRNAVISLVSTFLYTEKNNADTSSVSA